jgi:nicotinate-nucleotide adenylyltransferase
MEVALFGGSFDPPHVGHLLAAAYVLATEPVDELWFLPVYEHPFRKRLKGPFVHRLQLLRASLDAVGLLRASVSPLEQQLAEAGGEGRTVELLEHLVATVPETRFALVIGSDLLAETRQWKRFDRVQELARLIVLERGGHPTGRAAEPVIPEISSTQVRALLAAGADASALIARPALELIREAGHYAR